MVVWNSCDEGREGYSPTAVTGAEKGPERKPSCMSDVLRVVHDDGAAFA